MDFVCYLNRLINIYTINYMTKNIYFFLFIIIASFFLYITQSKYGKISLNKTISACVIAQMKKNKNLGKFNAEAFCKKEITKKNKD